jgi:putative spermidine/putrescine transport system substrate-binding protein
MNRSKGTFSQLDLVRRDFLKGLAAAGVGVAASPLLGARPAAADNAVVRGYGVTTAQLKDWSIMSKSLGIDMQFTPTNNDVGVFMRDVMQAQLGDKVDIFIFEAGTQNILGPQGLYLVIDEKNPELKLWDRTADEWKRSEVVVGADGKQYGTPVIGNADSFGYFPEKIGAAKDGEADISWKMLFESDVTRGRAAYDQTWTYSMPEAALFLQQAGRVPIKDVVDMTKEEAKGVADYLIERKKAGQFRTLHKAFEEQVQLLVTREVDIINCWEPATREANRQLGAGTVMYAYTNEGYFKWGHGAYIASQAQSRGNLDNIYKVLNYFLDGEYRAYQARDRGYAGPNMDLGVKYAEDKGWAQADIDSLKHNEVKIARKFKKPFVSTTTPKNADVMEEEWQRFLNA